jgi:hypothetical protein
MREALHYFTWEHVKTAERSGQTFDRLHLIYLLPGVFPHHARWGWAQREQQGFFSSGFWLVFMFFPILG